MVLFGLTRASVRGRALRRCDGNRCGGGVDRRGLGSRKRLPALRTSREHGPVQVLPAVVASRLTAKPCLRSVWREFLERTIVTRMLTLATPLKFRARKTASSTSRQHLVNIGPQSSTLRHQLSHPAPAG